MATGPTGDWGSLSRRDQKFDRAFIFLFLTVTRANGNMDLRVAPDWLRRIRGAGISQFDLRDHAFELGFNQGKSSPGRTIL